ncbi:MAG: glycosyltransferase family 2 protein [Pseudomonadota bacterium]
MTDPVVTVAVPAFNQGRYLDKALASLFEQQVPVEVFVMDGGSTDETPAVLDKWAPRLAGYRSEKDDGQAASINEGISRGSAEFVCWLNSDDWFLPAGLTTLLEAARAHPEAPVIYGCCWNHIESTGDKTKVWVEPFDKHRLALRCIISQPATLIRRSAWEAVGGVNPDLHMAMDYDLWWRIYNHSGAFHYVAEDVAVNRVHAETKTRNNRKLHYREAMSVVKREYGSVPLKWWLAQPYAVWFKALVNQVSHPKEERRD